jgi:hypothetical protein
MLPPLTVNRGLLFGSGATVPVTADGWQTGAIFQQTDGSAGTAFYINEGSVTSSNFTAVVTAGYATPITISPASAIPHLDFALETEWTGGSLIRADYGSSSTLTAATTGIELELGTNVVATSEQSVTGVIVTLPQMTISAASANLKGLQVAVTGAIVQTTSGTTTFRGVDVAIPEITQTAGTVITHGFYVSGGTINSGTAVGLELASGNWTDGIIIGTCSGNSIVCKDAIKISPEGTGTLLNFVLETEWVNGQLILANFDSGTTFTGAVKGLVFDFGTNVVATSEQDVTGIEITLPESTNTEASPDLKGVVVDGSTGTMTAVTSGDPTFMGVQITTPAIVCTLDTIVSSGLDITTGAITQTGGTATSNGIALTGGAITTGTATGINMDGAWTVGITINGTVATGIALDTCTSAAITAKDVIIIAPEAAGTLLDFQLETEWVSGSLIRADFGGGTTLNSAVIGCEFDFGTNIGATDEQSVTGYKITLPQSTNDAASPTLNGLEVAVSGAMSTASSGTATFNGVKIACPEITQTAGTCTSNGILITGGTINSGTAIGLNLAGVWTEAIKVTEAENLFQLPASGTAPVEAAGAAYKHGTATLKIRIEINDVEYFLLASTVPVTQ